MVRTSNVLCIATHTVPRTYPYLVGVDLGILSMRRSWSAGGLHTTLDTIICYEKLQNRLGDQQIISSVNREKFTLPGEVEVCSLYITVN